MTANPIDTAIVDGADVSKSAVRSYEKTYVRQRYANASTVNSTNLSGQQGIYVASLGASFDLDTASIAADNGATILKDSAGNRFVIVGDTPPALPLNLIVNGGMQIDQANEGAAVTVNSTSSTYAADQWIGQGKGSAGVFTLQRKDGTADTTLVDTGQINYLRAAVTTNATPSSTDAYVLSQRIEGLRVSNLRLGTSAAVAIALSFWVRSSLTGQFGGALKNSATDRAYPFSFTINAANTWEYKTVLLTGDLTGTWLVTNGIGLRVMFDLGSSTLRAAASAWAAGNYVGATGDTNLIATNGATFDLTGVQLEARSQASPFLYRSHNEELSICQRSYQKSYELGTALGASTSVGAIFWFVLMAAATVSWLGSSQKLSPKMRATPTLSFWTLTGTSGKFRDVANGADVTVSAGDVGSNSFGWYVTLSAPNVNGNVQGHYAADARL